MAGRKIRQGAVLVCAAAIAAGLANILGHHHESVSTIISCSLAVFFTGYTFAMRGLRPERTFTCPDADCAVVVTTTGSSAAENIRLRAYATDHTRHGTAAT